MPWFLNWLRGVQSLIKMERSSGFRPYLIFLAIVSLVMVVLLFKFSEISAILSLAIFVIKASVLAFIVIFAIKAFQDPNFCRSERHVETVKKMEMMEQKGDQMPQPIQAGADAVLTNPNPPQLEDSPGAR